MPYRTDHHQTSENHYSYAATEIIGTNDEMWNDLKSIFPNDRADRFNWLLCSTSGIHGDYTNLNEIEDPNIGYEEDKDYFDGTLEEWIEEEHSKHITILVIQPRRCHLFYAGELEIRGPEDITWLRNMVDSSIQEILDSQKGNRWAK